MPQHSQLQPQVHTHESKLIEKYRHSLELKSNEIATSFLCFRSVYLTRKEIQCCWLLCLLITYTYSYTQKHAENENKRNY